MFLTGLLRAGFADEVARNMPMPDFELEGELLAPPHTENYSLIGTAFDYLLRIELKRVNPWAREGYLAGERGFDIVSFAIEHTGKAELENCTIGREEFQYIVEVREKFYEGRERFLSGGALRDNFIEAILGFSKLDSIYRASFYENNHTIDRNDIIDMRALYNLIPGELKKHVSPVITNPNLSTKTVAADADLIIEDRLIDIKTVKRMELDKYMWAQIVSYLVLADASGEDDFPIINKIGIILLAIWQALDN